MFREGKKLHLNCSQMICENVESLISYNVIEDSRSSDSLGDSSYLATTTIVGLLYWLHWDVHKMGNKSACFYF